MKKTFEQILEYNTVAQSITNKFGEDPKNKFLYSVVKNLKKISKILEDYNKWQNEYSEDKLTDIKIELASVDKDNNLIMDADGKFSYTKENMKKLNKQMVALQKELVDRLEEYKLKEFEIDNYLTSDDKSVILENLNEDQIKALKGFVLKEDFILKNE